jgi:hypothetical protein
MNRTYLTATVLFTFAALSAGCFKDSTGLSESQDDGTVNVREGGMSTECTTIQSGLLETTDGQTIRPGYDDWGYNYQAHMFNGMYCDAYRDAAWCQLYKDDGLMMQWNDAWLSNKDCDDDGLLDRHLGFDSYIGSGAWLTNHMAGEYEADGQACKWNYFVKIVAVPEDATTSDGVWHAADGTEIGPVIWGEFAIIQQAENDPCAGIQGIQYLSPDHPGLSGW